jgi:hypothetical protein
MSNSPERGMKLLSPAPDGTVEGEDVLVGTDVSLDKLQGKDLRRNPYGPGKFEGTFNKNLAQALYDMTMESGQDDEAGDVIEAGMWAGFFADLTEYNIKQEGRPVVAAIVSEDSNGFFDYTPYTSKKDAASDWAKLAKELNAFYDE